MWNGIVVHSEESELVFPAAEVTKAPDWVWGEAGKGLDQGDQGAAEVHHVEVLWGFERLAFWEAGYLCFSLIEWVVNDRVCPVH